MRWLALLALATSPAAASAQDGSWTFGPTVGNYRLDAVSSPEIFPGPLGALDPTLTLTLGRRYEVTTPGEAHPLGIIAKGATVAGDVVLLHQGATGGTLEGDPGIQFADAGNKITFTVTQTLVDAMNAGGIPGYRCGNHPGTMRGNFAIAEPAPVTPLFGAPAWLALVLLLIAVTWLLGATPARQKW